jgi:ABC-2 type transport system ATP-binding protein
MSPATAAVDVRDLVKRYPVFAGFRELVRHPWRRETRTALDGATLRVNRGECFCLLGPNGAGKTTLVKVLTTLVLPNGGQAFVNGFDVEKSPASVRRSVGYALNDERGFYWRLTGRQNLEFFGALNNLRGSRLTGKIREVLSLTGLASAADVRFNAYSTGMRQMLAFARALLIDAEILFVDEPTRSLDPRAAEKVRSFLRDELVRKQGRTVFWVSHNLGEAAAVADGIAVIENGRIRVRGTADELTDGGRVSLSEVYRTALESGGEGPPGSAAREEGP